LGTADGPVVGDTVAPDGGSGGDEGGSRGAQEKKDWCFAKHDLDCGAFLYSFAQDQKAPQYQLTALLDGVKDFICAVKRSFDFSDPDAFSARIFQGKSVKAAEAAAKSLKVAITTRT